MASQVTNFSNKFTCFHPTLQGSGGQSTKKQLKLFFLLFTLCFLNDIINDVIQMTSQITNEVKAQI